MKLITNRTRWISATKDNEHFPTEIEPIFPRENIPRAEACYYQFDHWRLKQISI